MKSTRAHLHERNKKRSSFHKVCTYKHHNPDLNFTSEELHGYEFQHRRFPSQQVLVLRKEEIRLTPISLPTPPASPEVWAYSLDKWYHKKPLFTLTAKGQVKRIEKYLQIQKTLEMCKREYEIQKQTEDMKRAYLEYEFEEQQPLLYEVVEEIEYIPSKNAAVYFEPPRKSSSQETPRISSRSVSLAEAAEKATLSLSNKNLSTTAADEDIIKGIIKDSYPEVPKAPYSTPAQSINDIQEGGEEKPVEEKITKSRAIREGTKDTNDHRSVQRIVLKNKLDNTRARYKIKLNYQRDEDVYHLAEKLDRFHGMPKRVGRVNSGVSKINVGNIKLPFDCQKVAHRNTNSGYGYDKNCCGCRCQSANSDLCRDKPSVKFDINENEIH